MKASPQLGGKALVVSANGGMGSVVAVSLAGAGVDPQLMIQPADIAHTVLYILSMPATACPTEITILPQRSPYV